MRFIKHLMEQWAEDDEFYSKPLQSCWLDDLKRVFAEKTIELNDVPLFAARRIERQLHKAKCADALDLQEAGEDDARLYRLHHGFSKRGNVVVATFGDLKLIMEEQKFWTDSQIRWSLEHYLVTSEAFPDVVWSVQQSPYSSEMGAAMRPRLPGVLGQFAERFIPLEEKFRNSFRKKPDLETFGISKATKRDMGKCLRNKQFGILGEIFEEGWKQKALASQSKSPCWFYSCLLRVTLCLCLLEVDAEYPELVRTTLRRRVKRYGSDWAEEVRLLDKIKP